MRKVRLIARLDIKSSNLIKAIHLEGLRIVGDPNTYAKKYYQEGVDELIFMDCVATLYGRNNLSNIITSNDGTIEDLDRWGMRKLAYPINKFREGNYISSSVNIDPSKVTTIEGSIRSNEDILRHLFTVKD